MNTSITTSPADHPTVVRALDELKLHAEQDPKAAAIRTDLLEAIRYMAGKRSDLEDQADRLGLEQARSSYFVRVARNPEHASGVMQMGAKRAEAEIAGRIADITHGCNSLQHLLLDARRLCSGISSDDRDAFGLYCPTYINDLRADATIRMNFAAGLALGAPGAQALQKGIDKSASGDFAKAATVCYRLAAAAADGLNRENKKMKPDPDVVRDGELLVRSLAELARAAELGGIDVLQARGPKVAEMVRTSALR